MARHLKNERVSFLEKPVTAAELEIAELLKDYVQARIDKNIENISAFFSEHAEFWRGGIVKKNKTHHFKEIEILHGKIKFICLNNVLIRATKDDSATVWANVTFKLRNKIYSPLRTLILTKRDGIWKIDKLFMLCLLPKRKNLKEKNQI